MFTTKQQRSIYTKEYGSLSVLNKVLIQLRVNKLVSLSIRVIYDLKLLLGEVRKRTQTVNS